MFRFLIICAACIMPCAVVSASYIEMATGFTVVESPDGARLLLASENKGDEPSYDVQLEVKAGKKQFTSPPVVRLSVKERVEHQFPLDDAFDLPGRYPVIVKTHYKDANGYSFSALTVGFYDYREPVLSKIQIRAADATLPANGSTGLRVTVRNSDSVPREVRLELHLPDELASRRTSEDMSLAAGSETTVEYAIDNFSALENSAYAIAVVAEYADAEYHYSASGPAVVRVTEPRAYANGRIWVFAAVSLIVLGLAIILSRRQGKKARS